MSDHAASSARNPENNPWALNAAIEAARAMEQASAGVQLSRQAQDLLGQLTRFRIS